MFVEISIMNISLNFSFVFYFHIICRFFLVVMEPVAKLPSLKRSRDLDTDWTKCLFCQKAKSKMELTRVTNKMIQRILEVINERARYDDDNEIFERLCSSDLDKYSQTMIIQNHKSCYSSFTTSTYIKRLKKHWHEKKKGAESSVITEPARPVSRSLVKKLNSDLCIFCQEIRKGGKGRVHETA